VRQIQQQLGKPRRPADNNVGPPHKGKAPISDAMRTTVLTALLAGGGIRCYSHRLQYIEKLLALTDEEPICGEAINRCHGAPKSIGQRTND
jgi:hypothetical protein